MKIDIALIEPLPGIGGGNRKYAMYFKYMDSKYYNKFLIRITDTPGVVKKDQYHYEMSYDDLVGFLEKENITFVYPGLIMPQEIVAAIKKRAYILRNVSFIGTYRKDVRSINLMISKTNLLQVEKIQGEKLTNSYVVYNPVDTKKWDTLKGKTDTYREPFKGKKFIVGRLGRAEPSKWHFSMLKTLVLLDKQKNYDYGFIFAGFPKLYSWYIKKFTSKKMQACIQIIPELKSDKHLAEFYNSIDLFWQTSWIGESFGNVIAESFCFNVPVLTDYKDFNEDGKVYLWRYDTQIELVDHNVNGYYATTPKGIIKTFNATSKKELDKLGKQGYKKVISEYDAASTGDTMAKILYSFGKQEGFYKESATFEKLKQIPSQESVDNIQQDYNQWIAAARKADPIKKRSLWYRFESKMFRWLEYIYLYARKRGLVVEHPPKK